MTTTRYTTGNGLGPAQPHLPPSKMCSPSNTQKKLYEKKDCMKKGLYKKKVNPERKNKNRDVVSKR